MEPIKSAVGFEKWALKEKGPNWYKDEKILKYYGIEQLKRLYPKYFKEDIKPQQSIIENTVYKNYLQPTPRILYPTPFDEDFEEKYTVVGNIFNLTLEFNFDDVKLNQDRLMNEAVSIFKSEQGNQDRTLDEIIYYTSMGHKLEQLLIDKHNFKDDIRKYMDLLSQEGFTVDCKVVSINKLNENTIDNIVLKLQNKTYSPKTDYAVIYTYDNKKYKYYATIKL